jgi:AcrR family transcriptional regulator
MSRPAGGRQPTTRVGVPDVRPVLGRPVEVRSRGVADARRLAVLQQLEELFLSEGFAHYTIDALSKDLRCSKSTLYAIAASREQIVVAAVKQFFRGAGQRIEERVRSISDPREKVAAYLAGVGDEMGRMSPRGYVDMISFAPTRDIYDRNSRTAAGRVNDFIREGIQEGAFRAVHAQFIGEAISLVIEGIQHGALLDRTGLSSGEAYRELSAMVLSALTNEQTTT